ncbi:unnamed protein product [Paramecium octaurelia]|uniref:Uncharacterized protein n=1 Tax=Paramecium octaurelia TaxID=43137 RepID=A0A8S1TGU1_PAROT|nr:unnamed protein product [Paramecium octaurelia]
MRHQNNHIQNLHLIAARLSAAKSTQKSFLNDSCQILTQQTNLSINQSFSSPKYVSTQHSFILPQPVNTSMSMRDTQQSYKCSSPSMRVQTEKNDKDDKKQQQFIEATFKLLAQNEKLEKLISQQNEMLQMYREDKKELEITIKRLNQEIQFLKDANYKQVSMLEKQLKQVKGNSYYLPKKLFK